jgi:hypothetical protein
MGGAIAALVPGRTNIQCNNRWKKYINPSRSTVLGKEYGILHKAHALRRILPPLDARRIHGCDISTSTLPSIVIMALK